MYRQVDRRFALYVDDVAPTRHAWILDSFIRHVHHAAARAGRGHRMSHDPADPADQWARTTLETAARRASAASAYSIDGELLYAAVREAHRLLYTPLPSAPPWPALPLWVEWSGCALGDNPDTLADRYTDMRPRPSGQGFAITSLFVDRSRESALVLAADGRRVESEIEVIRAAVLDRAFAVKMMVYTPDQRWNVEQTGICPMSRCTIARHTRPGELYLISERNDEAEALSCGCACWRNGHFYARLLWTLAHLLGAEGVESETVDRTVPLPVAPRSSAKGDLRAFQQQRQAIARANARRPTITRISWGRLRHGKAQVLRDADGASVLVYEDPGPSVSSPAAQPGWTPGWAAGEDAERIIIETQNRAHARLLIAGPGRPWKKTQVIPVRPSRPYQREVSPRHSGHGRLRVLGGPDTMG